MNKQLLIGWVTTGLVWIMSPLSFGQLPMSLPGGPPVSPTTPVPAALSGLKAGQSETAIGVESSVPATGFAQPAKANGASGIPPFAGLPATPANAVTPESESQRQTSLASAEMEIAEPGSGSESDRRGGNSANLNQPNGHLQAMPDPAKLTATTGRRDPIRAATASAESADASDKTSFRTTGPTIQVETVGPRSIAINKPTEFEIRVTNSGTQEARGLNVEANFPAFVDLMSTRPSSGSFEQQDAGNQPRLKWRIESLPPGRSESAILQVIPRNAKLFDFQVQWVADPLRGQAAIQVTEPKLDMRIAGPTEVHYGQTAVYSVTLRNPGTGVAENVEIMLSEDLGGQRAAVGNLQPGEERTFEVELIPGEAGPLALEAYAIAENLEHSAAKEIIVRRANLELQMEGPAAAYAGTPCYYTIHVRNTGDAVAKDVIAAAVLPPGAKYVSGIEGAEQVQSGLRWEVGNLPIGEVRQYEIKCVYSQAGDLRLETGVRAADDLAATNWVGTQIQALADLVLSVESPAGPMPINQEVVYLLKVKNRGTSAGSDIQVAMQFSEGIEPSGATGLAYDIEPGQIIFRKIERLDVDQELVIRVNAIAERSGNHRFRAVLNCDDPVSEEIAQGTSRFYGNEINMAQGDEQRRGPGLDSGLRR